MALGAIFSNNVGQTNDQNSARECSTNSPIVYNAMSEYKIIVFEVCVSLVQGVSDDLRMLGTFLPRLRPRRSICNRNSHRIRSYRVVSFGVTRFFHRLRLSRDNISKPKLSPSQKFSDQIRAVMYRRLELFTPATRSRNSNRVTKGKEYRGKYNTPYRVFDFYSS